MTDTTTQLATLWRDMLHEADHAPTVDADGRTWFDVRPLTDPRERSAHQIDIATEALELGTATGLLTRHPQHPHLVRLLPRSAPLTTTVH